MSNEHMCPGSGMHGGCLDKMLASEQIFDGVSTKNPLD